MHRLKIILKWMVFWRRCVHRLYNENNQMQMIRHNDIQRNLCIRVMLCDLFNTLARIIAYFRQHHFSIFNFTEIVFSAFCADGDEIGTAVIIMPPCTCGIYSVFVLKFIVGHSCMNLLICRDGACTVSVNKNNRHETVRAPSLQCSTGLA